MSRKTVQKVCIHIVLYTYAIEAAQSKMENIFSGLITSKTRIKLLVRLFFNPQVKSYLRQLAKEFNLSTNAVREELNQLKKADLLRSEKCGRQIHYRANTDHPLFPELKSMAAKAVGFDRIIASIVNRLGELESAYVIDDYAEGKDNGIIDLILVGNIDAYHLTDLCKKTEKYIKRKIRPLVLPAAEFRDFEKELIKRPHFLIWEATPKKATSGGMANAEELYSNTTDCF